MLQHILSTDTSNDLVTPISCFLFNEKKEGLNKNFYGLIPSALGDI